MFGNTVASVFPALQDNSYEPRQKLRDEGEGAVPRVPSLDSYLIAANDTPMYGWHPQPLHQAVTWVHLTDGEMDSQGSDLPKKVLSQDFKQSLKNQVSFTSLNSL